MTGKVEFFFVVVGISYDTEAAAIAERNALLTDGYHCEIEAYCYIDGEVYSIEEGKRELQFQSDCKLAEERNSLID